MFCFYIIIRLTMPKLYLICGFLGAGKTTFAKKLATATSAQYFNTDALVISLFPRNEYESKWETCFAHATNIIWDQIAICAKNDRDAIYDAGFWTHAERNLARQRAIKIGMKPVLYYVYAPDKILKQRIAQRQGKIAENNIKNFDKIKESFEFPTPAEDFILINNF